MIESSYTVRRTRSEVLASGPAYTELHDLTVAKISEDDTPERKSGKLFGL